MREYKRLFLKYFSTIGKPRVKGEMGMRIRSPRGVDLMKAGLPEYFTTGGLHNTAIARIPLESTQVPQQVFQNIVDKIWMKTTRVSVLTPQDDVDPN
jgi:hypothetical protein